MKNRVLITIAALFVFIAVILSFTHFQNQTEAYIDEQIDIQLERSQLDSIVIIQNEMGYLMRMTEAIAEVLQHVHLESHEAIAKLMRDTAETSGIVRLLFVTLDGHAYTSYAGYLGQDEKNTSFQGVSLSEMKEPFISKPFYLDEVNQIVFGVIMPATIGERAGVLVSSYNLIDISNLLIERFPNDEIDIYIIDSDGDILCSKDLREFGENYYENIRNSEFSSSSLGTMLYDVYLGKTGIMSYKDNGTGYYSTYRPLNINGWYMVFSVEESLITGRYASLRRYGLQLTFELILVMVFLLFVIVAIRIRYDRKMRERIKREAMYDGLTHIYNRKAIEEIIIDKLKTVDESLDPVLMIIDVDNFKQINDAKGHRLGDIVLEECARFLLKAFKDQGIAGRLGGDEFVVFLPDGRDKEDIENKLLEIRKDKIVTLEGDSVTFTVSIGSARVKEVGRDFKLLYQNADVEMYKEKDKKRAEKQDYS